MSSAEDLPDYVVPSDILHVSDERHGRTFGHHKQFAQRLPGRTWLYTRVRVPLEKLRCCYPSIGENDACPGLLAEIGAPDRDLRGARIIDVAQEVATALRASQQLREGCSIQRIQLLRAMPKEDLEDCEQSIMVIALETVAHLIEGNHRCIALALNGVREVNAVLFDRIHPMQ